MMSRVPLLILLSLAACAPRRVVPNPECRDRPVTDGRFSANGGELVKLAGGYELTLVNSEGGYGDPVVRGRLNLWPNNSVRRYAWVARTVGRVRGERPLFGAFESRSSTMPSYPKLRTPEAADDPAVELVTQTLYFGGVDRIDGTGERLQITSISLTGFSGTWTHDRGIEMTVDSATGQRLREPGGHFCAVRLPKD
jgi:hypothetical protein